MATSVESLYESDYFAWAEAQARALRELEEARWNGPLDLEHLAEEVEDLARAERNAVLSQAERLIAHFLKLEYSASAEPRRQWIVSVDDARRELAKHLTPSLRRELDAVLPAVYQAERKRTARKLALYGEADAAAALPPACPYGTNELLDEDWFPSNRHGLTASM